MPKEPSQPLVFIVDDEPVIATTMGMILRQHGFDAQAFTLPVEALRASRETPPDLLVSDVMMPVLSGIDLAIRVREHCPACKVLLFSGQPATADLLTMARASGNPFEALAKPVHPAELLEKIRTLMDGQAARQNHQGL